jgi:hypothetical protein
MNWALGGTHSGGGNGLSLTRIDPNLYGNDVINWQAAAASPGQ